MDKEAIIQYVKGRLEGSDCFLVDVSIGSDNDITIDIDSPNGVDIDRCVELSRGFEHEFDRDVEDYSLTVGSAGLTEPFKVKEQYIMHIGDQVEVLAGDGRKYRGVLAEVGDDTFTVTVAEKMRLEGAKRPVMTDVPHIFRFDQVKYTKYLLQF